MLKYYNYDIVFSEIPDEATLAVNITGCPNGCKGCHSPWLQQDIGIPLDDAELLRLVTSFADAITCVCLMGGDNNPQEVQRLALVIRGVYPHLAMAWYSGRNTLPETIVPTSFQYIKLGPYNEQAGALNVRTTNQRLYHISTDGTMSDITYLFWR